MSDDDEGKEDKTELSGKVDDASAGNMRSSMRMIYSRAASSTVHRTATVPPSILVGGATVALALASALAVGGMGGHMKLEPPENLLERDSPLSGTS